MKRLLIYEPTRRRLESGLATLPPHQLIIMDEDGQFRIEGRVVTNADAAPDFTWLGVDVFLSKHKEQYADLVLASPTFQWAHSAAAGLDYWIVQV